MTSWLGVSWFEHVLNSVCNKIFMNQRSVNNAHREIIQWTLPFNPLSWQKLSMLLVVQGCTLCTVCRHYAQRAAFLYSICERVLHWSLVKNIMNMELSTAINGQSQRAECWSEWTLDDCMCFVCAVHNAWTSGQPCTVKIFGTMWFVRCVFNWLYVFSEMNDSNSGPDHGKIKSSKYLELSNLLI